MNFVFISPQFPRTYWNFCDRLKRNGVNVLGIGDTPYDELPVELKSSLTEYYRLDTLEDYDQMLRAIGFFTFKYGKIDWIESNNEYWLEQDARLESMTVWPPSIMDIVLEQRDLSYYVAAQMPEPLLRLGRATVKAFGAKSRFVHMEFFRLTKARKGLGEVGDFVGLEVNMRPAGGYTPDMMNYAHSTDVYQIWADMVSANRRLLPERGEDHYCVYASQRDCFTYRHSHQEILDRYGERIVMCERMPEINVAQMGNQMYTAHAATQEETEEFIRFVTDRV
ncbi:MAG: hypothetical protein LUF78_00115 [Clostridiales bacterium]|nr:hypothetical protein [Clostridiales bacterium]